MDPNTFVNRRERISQSLEGNSLAIIIGNTEIPKSNDQYFPFRQDSNFYYLTGLTIPDCLLIISSPDAADPKQSFLFIPSVDSEKAIWEGKGLNHQEIKQLSGIDKIYPNQKLDEWLNRLTPEVDVIYCNENDSIPPAKRKFTPHYHFIHDFSLKFPLLQCKSLMPVLKKMRMLKDEGEIDTIKKSIAISNLAFHSVCEILQEGINERDIANQLSKVFRNNMADHAFHPIVASGVNACTLHYHQNDTDCKPGELILMDFGSHQNYYNADITRVLPVNGVFSKRQKEIYNSVLSAKKFAISLMKTGQSMKVWNREVGQFLQSELISLGILSKGVENVEAYKRYFMHGVGHHLGLDVHDLSDRSQIFKKGMILTCEPGLYIPDEKIGVRLEDNILISAEGPVNLSTEIPIEIEEIEELLMR